MRSRKTKKANAIGRFVEGGVSGDYSYGVARWDDADAWAHIKAGDWKFVSPQIQVMSRAPHYDSNGQEMIYDYAFRHVAFVNDPAYSGKAGIKGTCTADNPGACMFSASLEDYMEDQVIRVASIVESET